MPVRIMDDESEVERNDRAKTEPSSPNSTGEGRHVPFSEILAARRAEALRQRQVGSYNKENR